MNISAASSISSRYPAGTVSGNAAFSGIQPSISSPHKPGTRQTEISDIQQNNSAEQTDGQAPDAQQVQEKINGRVLDQNELRVLEQLKQRDAEVRRHEMAHIAAGGRYIKSGANFSYQRGPDGKNYAIGGEVSIDTSPVPGDPQATIQKMRQVKSSALAPANPSSQDLKVAANATAQVSKALSELMVLQAKEQAGENESKAFGNLKDAAGSYEKVNGLPETDTATIEIAV